MDYKEYSRLRSIARKRIERASAAGKMQYVEIPTVKQVKASDNPEAFLRSVKDFLSAGSLRDVKKSGGNLPGFTAPKAPTIAPRSEADKKARRREQSRRSKAKRAVERSAKSAEDAKNKVGFLKGLETVAKRWREQGLDIGNWLGILSPSKAKAFTDYMEYRFSQADYKNRYTIDTFIRDFGELMRAGYNVNDIQKDFDVFLEKRKEMFKGQKRTNKHGITIDEVSEAWRLFVKSNTGKWNTGT